MAMVPAISNSGCSRVNTELFSMTEQALSDKYSLDFTAIYFEKSHSEIYDSAINVTCYMNDDNSLRFLANINPDYSLNDDEYIERLVSREIEKELEECLKSNSLEGNSFFTTKDSNKEISDPQITVSEYLEAAPDSFFLGSVIIPSSKFDKDFESNCRSALAQLGEKYPDMSCGVNICQIPDENYEACKSKLLVQSNYPGALFDSFGVVKDHEWLGNFEDGKADVWDASDNS